MLQHQEVLDVPTRGRSLTDVSGEIGAIVTRSGVQKGLCTVFCRHTSASLVIQENADPAVQRDLLTWLAGVAPDGAPAYTHTAEGPDDMAAHLRGAITRTSEVIPIVDGDLALGIWQGVYLAEHRTAPHRRRLVVHILGE